jgi:hypothetical protein
VAEEFDPTEFAQGLTGSAFAGQQAGPADGLAGLLLPTTGDEQLQQATAQAGSLRAGAESGELRMEARNAPGSATWRSRISTTS